MFEVVELASGDSPSSRCPTATTNNSPACARSSRNGGCCLSPMLRDSSTAAPRSSPLLPTLGPRTGPSSWRRQPSHSRVEFNDTSKARMPTRAIEPGAADVSRATRIPIATTCGTTPQRLVWISSWKRGPVTVGSARYRPCAAALFWQSRETEYDVTNVRRPTSGDSAFELTLH